MPIDLTVLPIIIMFFVRSNNSVNMDLIVLGHARNRPSQQNTWNALTATQALQLVRLTISENRSVYKA